MDGRAANKQKERAIHLYRNLMDEIKLRMRSIELSVNGGTSLPNPLVREYCYLQFRMICELVALGCLVANGEAEFTKNNRLNKQYSAEKIFEILQAVHPDFYPTPVSIKQTGPNSHHVEPIKSGFMSREEMVRLYSSCGNTLHRGSLKRLISSKNPSGVTLTEVRTLTERMLNLLRVHHVAMLGHKEFYLCILEAAHAGGGVQVVRAAMVPGGPPSGII